MKVFAVVPVYNEKIEIVNKIVSELLDFVDKVVVVDDGSRYSVKEAVFRCKKNTGKIVCLCHQINRGQGAALQTGTDYAFLSGADIVVHFDGDGQHLATDVLALTGPIKKGQVEFVFGSKVLGRAENIPWSKKTFIIPLARFVNRILTGINLSDAHNGLRAFNRRAGDKINLSQDRMAHNTEYPYLVKKNNLKYKEVPVKVIYNQYGQGIGGGIRILKELILGWLLK